MNLCPTCYTPLQERTFPYVEPIQLGNDSHSQWVNRATLNVVRLICCTSCQKVIERLDGSNFEEDEQASEEMYMKMLADLLDYSDLDEDEDEDEEGEEDQEAPIEQADYSSMLTDLAPHKGPIPPLGDTQRHAPGAHNQKEHGDWAHPAPKPTSTSTSTTGTTTTKKKRKKGPKLSKMQRLQQSMQRKMAQYEKLSHRKITKKWTAADQQMAEKIADDLQSVLGALNKGHAAGMAQVKQLLADAEKLHDAAPKSMSEHRITALNNLLKRMTKVAGASRMAGVQLMRWVDKCGCEICQQNAGQVRPIGSPFPSGSVFPEAHSGCTCTLSPVEAEDE